MDGIRRGSSERGRDVNRSIMGMRRGMWKFVDNEGKREWKESRGKDRK